MSARMSGWYNSLKARNRHTAATLLALLLFPTISFALSYAPGQTLDPDCYPTDPTCIVVTPASTSTTAGIFVATTTNATSTFAGNVSISGTTQLGALTGVLRATNGVVATAPVNLSTDVMGALATANGGTGTTTAPSLGQILMGNGLGSYSLVASSSLITPTTNSLAASGNTLTSTVNGVSAATSVISNNGVSMAGNTLTSTVNGIAASTSIINSATASSSGNYFNILVNGIASATANLINSFTQSISGNTLTTTINGLTDASSIITGHTLSYSANTGTLTSNVNGVTDTATIVPNLSSVNGTLGVGNGGTGATTFPTNALLIGQGTSALASASIGTGLLLSGGSLSAAFATTQMNEWLTSAQLAGTVDASAAVQSMVNSLCAGTISGQVVEIGPAHIRAHDINVPCSIMFKGAGGNGSSSGTVWDFSGASDHGIRFEPNGWPHITHDQRIYHPGVEDITFYSSDSSSSQTRALDFLGIDSGVVQGVGFQGNIYNGIRLYGVYKFDLTDINADYYTNLGAGISNYVIEITGDMSGESRSGGSCSLGDCSTRTDIVSLHNVSSIGTNTGIGLYIHGTVDATMGEHISIENKQTGVFVGCDSGFPDLSYCPNFMTFTDLQSEGAVSEPIHLSDFSDFQCTNCYAVGNGSSDAHSVEAVFSNYAAGSGSGGGFRWIGGRIANAGGSCAWMSIPNSKIDHADILDCNLSNTGGSGIEYSGYHDHEAAYNTFCSLMSATGPAMSGVNVTNTTGPVDISHNSFNGCSTGLVGTPTSGDFIHSNNVGSTGEEQNTFQDNGYVGVGTRSPSVPIDVSATANLSGQSYGFLNSSGNTGVSSNQTISVSIRSSGRVEASEFDATSDARLKTILGQIDASSSIDTILHLVPVRYTWNALASSSDTSIKAGFTAQQVAPYVPEAVSIYRGVLPDQWHIDYSMITPYIVGALQGIINISGTFQQQLMAWLGNSNNGIGALFAHEGHFSDKICVGSTCVTEAQFQAMVAASGQGASTPGALIIGEGSSSTSTDASSSSDPGNTIGTTTIVNISSASSSADSTTTAP